MRLQINNGEITLPKDFVFQIKQNHPFFSEDGSASIPATLPATPDNMKALRYPADINRATRFSKQYDAMLYCGSYFKRCRMVVESGHRLDGIDMSLALDESEAYAEIQDKELKDVLSDEFFSVSGMTPYQVYSSNVRRDAVFFPVAVDLETSGSSSTVKQLNKVSNNDFEYASRSINHGDGTVTVGDGYGLTCFLRLPELISKIFTKCGYTVNSNVFATSAKLKSLVLLNNCADALMESTFSTTGWRVHYTDIIPNMTVGDLLAWLKDKFGAYFAISGKIVDIRLFQDDATVSPDFDFSAYVRKDAQPTVTYPDPKALVIGLDTSLDGAAPAADSLEALRASHQNMVEAASVSDISGNGLRFVKPLGKYYFRNTNWGTPTYIGSNAFNYKRTTAVKEDEEKITSDVFAPMIQTSSKYMPYIGASLRRNIDIDDRDKDAEQKMMLCNAIYANSHWQGSQFSYDDTGSAITGADAVIGLHPESIHDNFWGAYHRMLIDGSPEISCSVEMKKEDILSLNLWTPKLINGMRCFIKSIEYEIGETGKLSAALVLQTVPSYTDAVSIPGAITFGTAFGWQRYVDDDESDMPSGWATDWEYIEGDGLTDYTAADKPSWNPTAVGQIAKVRTRYYIYEETEYGNLNGRRGTHYYTEGFISVYTD